MVHIVWKKIKGKFGPYAYLYRSFRDSDGRVKTRFIKYLGKIPQGTKIAHVRQKKTPALRKKGIKPRKHRRRRIQGRRPKACTLPISQKCRHTRCLKYACQYYQPVVKKKKIRREK